MDMRHPMTTHRKHLKVSESPLPVLRGEGRTGEGEEGEEGDLEGDMNSYHG